MSRKFAVPVVMCLLGLLIAASAPISNIPFHLSNLTNDPLDPSFYDETHSAVTYNTGFMRTYFTVWQRNNTDGVSTTIYGRFYNFDGRLNGIVAAISPTVGLNTDPDIAYSEIGTPTLIDRYLIVYSRDGASIRGMILGNAGSPVGSELTIASTSGETYNRPAVAYSVTSHRWLVTWTHWDGATQNIQARTVDPTNGTLGTVYDMSGVGDPDASDVAWSQANNEFLVVWNETVGNMNVYGRRFQMSPTPQPAGSVFAIFFSSNSESYPAVASVRLTNGTGQYLVVCRTLMTSTHYIDGQLVNQAGSLTGPRLPVSGGDGGIPSVAGNSASQEYLVAWPHDSTSLYASTVAANGDLGPEIGLPLNDASDTAVAAGANGDFLITASGFVQASYPYDVWGFLWGTRLYLPLIMR